MTLYSIQNKLDRIRQSQESLAKEEAELLAQLKQMRSAGDPPFCFLYETGNDQQLRSRQFRSSTLGQAAAKMANFMQRHSNEWKDPRVDYEAELNGEYLDMYALGDNHPIAEYL